MSAYTLRARAVALAVALATGSMTGVAAGQAPKATGAAKPLAQTLTGGAKADYEAARVLLLNGDFAGAIIKFQSSYDQSKDPRLFYNVAACEKNLRHYAKAISILQRYLADGAGFLTDKDRKEAQDLIQTFQPFTTNATFKVSEDGAQIFVDDTPAGISPLAAPVVLDIGERHLRVVKDGFKPFEKTLPVGGSSAVSVDVTLIPEVHDGHLVINAPPDATLTLDDKPVGTGGKVDVTVAAGGHQLRATAAGMRAYQSEVVVQDKETRQVDVALEKELPPEKPRLRVAIGCDGPEPRGPDDGLVVYLDGPDVLPPSDVKKRWDDSEQRNVVEYVEYAVDAGRHTIRTRIPDCESLEATVQVDPQTGGRVVGALESDSARIMTGPQGSPGHWRIGANLYDLKMPDSYQVSSMPDSYGGGFGSAIGVALEGAYVSRWFGMFLQTAYAAGNATRHSFNSNAVLPGSTPLSVTMTSLRMSFRIPFHWVAWNVAGPEAGIGQVNLQGVETGGVQALLGAWTGIDIQPFCDWGGMVFGDALGVPGSQGGPAVTLQFGLFFEPNSRCRRERSTDFGLRAGEPPR